MGLFSKKKKDKDWLKPLSERDIQKKLYGDLRFGDSAQEVLPKAYQKFKAVPVSETVHNNPIPSYSLPADTLSDENPIADDLFSQSQEVRKSESGPTKEVEKVVHKESPREQNIMSRLTEIAEEEKKVSKPSWKKLRKPKKAVAIKKTKKSSFLQLVWKNITKISTAFLSVVSAALAFVFLIFGKIFQFLDPRKPKVRRVLYWVVGVTLLVGIFAGVHVLNVRREAAMKSSPRKKSVAPVAVGRSDQQVQKKESADSKSVRRKVVEAGSALSNPVAESRQVVITPASGVQRKEQASVNASTEKPEVSQEKVVDEQTGESSSDAGEYVIQVATYAGPNDAERVVSAFKDAGLSSFIKALSRKNTGKVYYSVFIGRFKNFNQAQEEFSRFKNTEAAKPFEDAFIRTLS